MNLRFIEESFTQDLSYDSMLKYMHDNYGNFFYTNKNIKFLKPFNFGIVAGIIESLDLPTWLIEFNNHYDNLCVSVDDSVLQWAYNYMEEAKKRVNVDFTRYMAGKELFLAEKPSSFTIHENDEGKLAIFLE